MSLVKVLIAGCLSICVVGNVFAQSAHADEMIVMIRHGEKTKENLGQLSCQGLNRALRLPKYFAKHFPKPDFIFAPNPSVQHKGFSYVRPLVTIEPTAIALTMPVNTQIGYNAPKKLLNTLLRRQYHHAVVFVAWEHAYLEKFAKLLLAHFHKTATVPHWKGSDYNRVFVFQIHWRGNNPQVRFMITSQHLNNLPKQCPF